MVPVEAAVNSSIEVNRGQCSALVLAHVVRNPTRIDQHQRLVMQRNKRCVQMHNLPNS
jgi:hypothetical protein